MSNVKFFANNRSNDWYFVTFTCGTVVMATRLTKINDFNQLQFDDAIVFDRLRSDFNVRIELYSTSDGTVSKRRSKIFSSARRLPKTNEKTIAVSSFKLRAELTTNVNDLSRDDVRTVTLRLTTFPSEMTLSGDVQIDVDRDVILNESHSGFLTIAHVTDGQLSWLRRWCRLQDGRLKYWNDPNEEEKCRKCSGIIDLRSCTKRKVAQCKRELCPRPRTLLVEIGDHRVRSDDVVRYFLSADNYDDMNAWMTKINSMLDYLTAWKLMSNVKF